MYAPVVFFAFNRPNHTFKSLQSLSLNNEAGDTDIYVFIDGHRKNSEIHLIDSVEKIVKSFMSCFKSIKISRSSENLSCGTNIRKGVTSVLNIHESAIVLEDDIYVSKYFLSYMNKALEIYKQNSNIWHINGFNYPINISGEFDCFFSRLMQCWGWATWSDRWNKFIDDPFSSDPYFLMQEFNIDMIRSFDLDSRKKTFWSQIEDNANGKLNNTWAIFWYSFIFRNKGLCLTPYLSLTRNIGHDGSGIHCGDNREMSLTPISSKKILRFPSDYIENKQSLRALKKYLDKNSNLIYRIFKKLKLIISPLIINLK